MATQPATDILGGVRTLDFAGFLTALGEADLAAALRSADIETLMGEQVRYEELLNQYCLVGGIPSVVQAFVRTRELGEARALQQQILAEIERTILQGARAALAGHALQVWRSAALQLAEENKKFFYNAAGQGGRMRTHIQAINWLVDAGLLIRVTRASGADAPLSELARQNAFKLYLFDTGLLAAALQVDEPAPEGVPILEVYEGALAENFVCQQFVARGINPLYYWTANNSFGKIDFLIEQNGVALPIEVQGTHNRKSKNLQAFIRRFGLAGGVRLAPSGFDDRGQIAEIPLYACSILAP